MSINMAEFHQVFFEESHEHLESMEQLLIALDLQSPDPEELNTIFRAAHSIKGGSGIFGFTALTSVTHVMENLLDKVRKGTFELSSGVIDLLLKTVDTLSHILSLYREDSPIDWQQVEFAKNQLIAALNGEPFSITHSNETFTSPIQTAVPHTATVLPKACDENDLGFGFFEDDVKLTLAIENQDFGFFDEAYIAKEISIDDLSKTVTNSQQLSTAPDDDLGFGFFESLTAESIDSEIDALVQIKTNPAHPIIEPIAEPISHHSGAKVPRYTGKVTQTEKTEPTDLVTSNASNQHVASAVTSPQATVATKKVNTTTQDATLRVETSKIDTLVNLAGELVITQSMLTLIGNELSGELGERLKTALV